jgi:hypothetical protein
VAFHPLAQQRLMNAAQAFAMLPPTQETAVAALRGLRGCLRQLGRDKLVTPAEVDIPLAALAQRFGDAAHLNLAVGLDHVRRSEAEMLVRPREYSFFMADMGDGKVRTRLPE